MVFTSSKGALEAEQLSNSIQAFFLKHPVAYSYSWRECLLYFSSNNELIQQTMFEHLYKVGQCQQGNFKLQKSAIVIMVSPCVTFNPLKPRVWERLVLPGGALRALP